MGRRRIAVIDVDSLLYSIALSAEMCAKGQGMNGDDMWFTVRNLDDCYREAEGRLEEILDKIEADDAIICLSDARCFRYDILPTYKSNRIRTRRPPMMVHLREELLERKPFKVLAVKTLEADDVAGITSTSMQKTGTYEPIIVSPDKDLLSIPGLLHRQGLTFEVSISEANRAHLFQTLVGDEIDGYKGLPGIGPKRADKILDDADTDSVKDMWSSVAAAFIARGHTEMEALQQARVARILRDEDWDRTKREVVLWTPK